MKSMYVLLAALILLPVNGSTQQTGECIDADGDGWGWNEDLKQSCIPSGSENPDRKDPVGVRISWPENPAAEMVEGYTLRLHVNDILAAEERTDGTSLSFQFEVIKAFFGDEICVQVAAFRNDENSDFSAVNCIVVPDQILPPMSVPGIPAIVWLYE